MTNTSNMCGLHFEGLENGVCPFCTQENAPVISKVSPTKAAMAVEYRASQNLPTKSEWIDGRNNPNWMGSVSGYEAGDYVEEAFIAGWEAAIQVAVDNLSYNDLEKMKQQLEELYGEAAKKHGW